MDLEREAVTTFFETLVTSWGGTGLAAALIAGTAHWWLEQRFVNGRPSILYRKGDQPKDDSQDE